ncbi:MAG: GyrI-like domain-containing protein [Opitutales bacterium]
MKLDCRRDADGFHLQAMDIELKVYPEQLFAFIQTKTTFTGLRATVEANLGPLMELSQTLGEPRPMTFFYRDVTGMDQEFTLQLALPIQECEQSKLGTSLKVKRVLPHACAYTTFTGSYDGLMGAWMQFYGGCEAQGYQTANEGREIYLKFDGDAASAENVTELQMAVLGQTLGV